MDMLLIEELAALAIHRFQYKKHLNSLMKKRNQLLYS